jgi:signal transduction histidine kinase
LNLRIKLWSAAVLACLAALVVAALMLRQSFRLTAFSDITQCLLLFSGALSFFVRAHNSKGRMRLFWSLMTLGLALWLSYQLLWTYFEIFLRTNVPDLFWGDIVLFVHIVPLIAAIALRPHVPRDQYAARLGHLDFALLFVWWVCLYALLVTAWQYATPDVGHYNDNLNAVYLAEKLFFLVALAACWTSSKGAWKAFYGNLFAASLLYATSSYIANWALSRRVYYSGSLYDIPLVASMAWMTLIALWNQPSEPETENTGTSTAYGIWIARCGMIAAFSLPLFGAWALADTGLTMEVRSFRIVLTLATALIMGMMVFVRQHLLERELNRLLRDSRASFENLKLLQVQIVQSEKMASIGRLVGGAAHELNNPITAMLGYSDLLLGTQLTGEQQTLAVQVNQHVRKTKSLVANLLSFARSAPANKSAVDLNTLARTAVKLTQLNWQTLKIEVAIDLDPALPRILGDSNQLLQVCLQILGNSLQSVHERRGTRLSLITELVAGNCVLTVGECIARGEYQDGIAKAVLASAPPADEIDPLGLTACRGIVQEHQGEISSRKCPDGSFTVRLDFPALNAVHGRVVGAKVPPLWQPQPFA